MNRIKIYTDENGGTRANINGVDIRARSVVFGQSVGELPRFSFDLNGFPEFDIEGADIRVSFTPATIFEAVRVLKHSLENDPVMRSSFEKSIWSVLEESEQPGYGVVTNEILAKRILDRVVGDEE